jgi:hypothetical protein
MDDFESVERDFDAGGGISPVPLGKGAGIEPGKGVVVGKAAVAPSGRQRVGSHGLGFAGGLYMRCRS